MPRAKAKPKSKSVDHKGLIRSLALNVDNPAVDSAGLLAAITDAWGGRVALARDVISEFKEAKPGSMPRQRILEMVSRLVIVVTNQDIARPRGAKEMTDDELNEFLELKLKRMIDNGPDTAAAGTEQTPSSDPLASPPSYSPAGSDDPAIGGFPCGVLAD